MGWQRPNEILYCKTCTGSTVSLRVHSTWTVAGIMSLLEVVHRIGPAGDMRMVFAGRQLEHSASLREAGLSHERTVHLILKLRGD